MKAPNPMRITAVAQRSGSWWAVEVPEIPGLFTQAKRLDQVTEMVRDAASALTGKPEDEFQVTISSVHINGQIDSVVDAAKEAAKALAEYQARAADASKTAAATLAEEGLTVREVGEVLGVSHQRAHQLISAVLGTSRGRVISKVTARGGIDADAGTTSGSSMPESLTRSQAPSMQIW